jgi:hypothetical protein
MEGAAEAAMSVQVIVSDGEEKSRLSRYESSSSALMKEDTKCAKKTKSTKEKKKGR